MMRILTLAALGLLVACMSFDLESRRFRCDSEPSICDDGMVCGADGFCALANTGEDAGADASIDGGGEEICDNGIDDDGDDDVDCDDSDCATGGNCGTGCICESGMAKEVACGDGADNDGDTDIDCNDSDCPMCTGGLMCCPDGGCRPSC